MSPWFLRITLNQVQRNVVYFCSAIWTKYMKMLKRSIELAAKVFIASCDPEQQKIVWDGTWMLNMPKNGESGNKNVTADVYRLPYMGVFLHQMMGLMDMLGPGELISDCSDCFKSVSSLLWLLFKQWVQTLWGNHWNHHLMALNYSVGKSF